MIKLQVSERRACKVIGQIRSTQRYEAKESDDEEFIRNRIIALAREYGRYGYRMVWGLLRNEGLMINHKRVERIWREEGLKVPEKQPKRARLWFADGSCVRLRPEYPNHVWSYDFVEDCTHDGRKIRVFNVIDEFTKEPLAMDVRRKFNWQGVKEVLSELFITRGCPKHVRSDNGPEFIAKHLRKWFKDLEVGPLYIEPGSPWENGYCESFNGKFRNELLNGEIFYTLLEAKVMVEKWRKHFITKRPHSSLGYRPPVPETVRPMQLMLATG